jgi:Ca2+-binding RTX toxin-like protein
MGDLMALVRGTNGNDFIHRKGDGLVTPVGKTNLLGATQGADTLLGRDGDDILRGDGGNDRLDGGLGTDRLIGGKGADIYVVDRTSDVVVEAADEGFDTVISTASYVLTPNIEKLVLKGDKNLFGRGNGLGNEMIGNTGNNILGGRGGNDTIRGGAGNDEVDGGEGNDMLYGGAGNDQLSGLGGGIDQLFGGAGDDTYLVGAGDSVVEAAGGGIDSVQTNAATYTLTANVENLTYFGNGNFAGTGNTLANQITGNAGNDTLDGAGGPIHSSGRWATTPMSSTMRATW